MDSARDVYDYVIVGAGTAGCVLADRLSRNPDVTVLLIERGGPATHLGLHVPRAYRSILGDDRYVARYPTEPVRPGGDGEVWIRGKVVGGSSAVNGMLYLRGDPADYEALAAAGGSAWGWQPMLASFRAIEDHALGASPERGVGGPLPVTITEHDDEVVRATLAAAAGLGVRPVPDVNAVTGERVGFVPTTIAAGRRVSTARAFLRHARTRPNLTVRERASVGYLRLDGRRVTGVRLRQRGTTSDVGARREVIVCAGTIGSPTLLERSGIGAPEVLASAGIAGLVAAPNVGRRVIEQRAVTVSASLDPRLGTGRGSSRPSRLLAVAHYLRGRRGPYATADHQLAAVVRSSDDVDRPDVQLLSSRPWPDASDDGGDDPVGLEIRGFPLRPSTRSEVHAASPVPDQPPRIEPRFVETDEDRRATAGTLRRIRELLAASPLANLVGRELAPGPSVVSEDEVVAYAVATGHGLYHGVGSCAMGPDDDDVVDGELRVRGVSGLRVVDASVLPRTPSGGTAAPVVALAWRAADLILGSDVDGG